MWSHGGASERQVRDATTIARLQADLDWAYVEQFAPRLGVTALVEHVRGG